MKLYLITQLYKFLEAELKEFLLNMLQELVNLMQKKI